MNCSTPGLPVHYQLPEFTQTLVHWVGDAIQPFHHQSPPSPPALNLSQHQGLFQWVSSSHEVAKVLEFQLQHQSFLLSMNTQDWSLGWTGWISLKSKGLPRVFSNTTVQKHQFFGTQCSARSPNPRSGKKTPWDNATCNRGIYYWLEPGPPSITKDVMTKRPTVLRTGACLCLPGGRKGSEPNWKMWGSWLFLLRCLGLQNHRNSPLAH